MAVSAIIFLNLAVLVASKDLQQVFVLSRHNIRAPLSDNLQSATTLKLPEWSVPATFLTEKGFSIEEKMGEYFSKWLKIQGLITEDCQSDKEVYIYSNNKQRTINTAKAFASSAFRNCNIETHYQKNGLTDLVFAPFLKNTTDVYKRNLIAHMQQKLDNLHLKEAYTVLHRIVDISNADICKQKILCDFETKDVIIYEIGEEPDIKGPLSIGNSLVDFFLMSYYDGIPMENIAWGKATKKDDWENLLKITRENQNVRFNNTRELAKDISKPMLKFMRDEFSKTPAPKFTMLVGHDSNLNSMLAALGFAPYNLPGQLEKTPVGGKIVFQKWRDADSNLFLKVEYIYYSMEQLRHGKDLENPQSVTLEMQDCKIDENGFCPWNKFVKVLN